MLLGTNTAYDFIKDVYEKGKDNIHVDKVQKQEQEQKQERCTVFEQMLRTSEQKHTKKVTKTDFWRN